MLVVPETNGIVSGTNQLFLCQEVPGKLVHPRIGGSKAAPGDFSLMNPINSWKNNPPRVKYGQKTTWQAFGGIVCFLKREKNANIPCIGSQSNHWNYKTHL